MSAASKAIALRRKYADRDKKKYTPRERKKIEVWVQHGHCPPGIPDLYRRISFCTECKKAIEWKSVFAWMRAWIRGLKYVNTHKECR